jgi:hypothetical protein
MSDCAARAGLGETERRSNSAGALTGKCLESNKPSREASSLSILAQEREKRNKLHWFSTLTFI